MSEGERRRRVLDAGLATFVRFGLRRTTMADIAQAAGMSRPSLYQLFDSKDAIFAAVLRDMGDRALAAIAAALPTQRDERDRLRLVIELWCVAGYALASTSPEATELVDASNDAGHEVMNAIYSQVETIIADILEPAAGADSTRAASVLMATARGFKHKRPSVENYREQMFKTIDIILAAYGSSAERRTAEEQK
jgi:AcrR family transcriptional regulator